MWWRTTHCRLFLPLTGLATAFSVGHHLDHLVRGNHVGWPLTGEVTPFTFSLIVYPLIALGFALSAIGRAGPGYWLVLAAAGFVLVGVAHFGPLTAEPPREIIEAYASPLAGWSAFALLLALLATLAFLAAYSTRCWRACTRSR